MLNVLSIAPYRFLPAKIGGQKCIAFGYEFLSKHLNITCITTKNNNAKNTNYEVLNILSDSKFRYVNIFYFFRIRKIIADKKITHVIIEHPYFGWLAILLKWFCGIKIIVRSHNIESIRFKSINKWWWKWLWQYEKMVHQKADLSLFITEEDKQFALNNFKLSESKTEIFTFGIVQTNTPTIEAVSNAKNIIKNNNQIYDSEIIIFFNGSLSYNPNLKALNIILTHINPILYSNSNFKYKIIISGNDLPMSYNNLENYKSKNIIFTGFINDISTYYLAADIFINPVNDGGGIKTKIVEALGYNNSLVTTKSGASGIPISITKNKMIVVDDDDWVAFANAIQNIDTNQNISEAFYSHFYWGNIAEKGARRIQNI